MYRQSVARSDAELQHHGVGPHLQVLLTNLQIDMVDVRVEILFGHAALLEKSCDQLRVRARQRFFQFDGRRVEHHDSPLRAGAALKQPENDRCRQQVLKRRHLPTGEFIQVSAVGEALVDGQIRRQHSSHHMVFLQVDDGLRFEGRVEITRQLKQPEVGRS